MSVRIVDAAEAKARRAREPFRAGQWEYQWLRDLTVGCLNDHGRAGWEVVHVGEGGCLLKRPIRSAPPVDLDGHG